MGGADGWVDQAASHRPTGDPAADLKPCIGLA